MKHNIYVQPADISMKLKANCPMISSVRFAVQVRMLLC